MRRCVNIRVYGIFCRIAIKADDDDEDIIAIPWHLGVCNPYKDANIHCTTQNPLYIKKNPLSMCKIKCIVSL